MKRRKVIRRVRSRRLDQWAHSPKTFTPEREAALFEVEACSPRTDTLN